MKLLYNTFTTEGKVEVMQHYSKDPAGLLLRDSEGNWKKHYPEGNNKINYVPSWDWHNCSYNYLAPEKKKVLKPWDKNSLPKDPNVLIRHVQANGITYNVIARSVSSVYYGEMCPINFLDLLDYWEYSFDGDNWAPCGIEVEE